MSHNITIESGTSVRLPTAGKYCDRDIVITAEGGKEDLDAVLTEQEALIEELKTVLAKKASGGGDSVIEPLEIIENGTYIAPEGVDGYSPVTVNVPIPDGYIKPSGTLEVTENGTHDVTEYASVNVNVPTGGGDNTGIVDALIDRSITEISSDITVIGYHALDNCDKLVSASFPNVTTVSGYGFQNCSSLKNVFMPKVQGVNGYGFYGCTSLEIVDFPSIRSIGNYAFRKCAALTKIDLYQTYSINLYAFYECTNLEAIILRKADKPCTLAAVNVFQYTKIADGTGYIYVPANLVEQYKSATNWSTYANQIRAIEDYPEITGG